MNQLSQYGRKWTRDETILALGLYFQIPFAKISSRNQEIRKLARLMKINALSGPRKIMDRCKAILENATDMEYEGYHSAVFADNLEVVDAALPAWPEVSCW